MLNLLHIYVSCSDAIAKHIKSVIGMLPVTEDGISTMVALNNNSMQAKLRILKLYRMFFDDEED
jgi:hypothetical protein